MRSLKKKSLCIAWHKTWLAKDFSWDGLAAKQAPEPDRFPNLQVFIRSLSADASDDMLIEMGVLIKCGGGKLFHILFVPPHWRSIYIGDEDNFLQIRSEFLELISKYNSNFQYKKISGFTFYSEDSVINMSRVLSYEFCYFENYVNFFDKNYNISLEYCYIDGDFDSIGNTGLPLCFNFTNVYVFGSVRIRAAEAHSLDLKINQSRIAECVMSDAKIKELHISKSTIGRLSIENSQVEKQVVISEVELVNGASFDSTDFNGHFSISNSKIISYLRFFDCDFDDRVVFRDIEWPKGMVSSAYTTGSRFRELVTFSSSATPPIQLFDGGTFEANIGFASSYHGRWNDAFLSELEPQYFDQSELSILASRIETGCRNLRNLAQERGDGPMEHFWHRAEIIARRKTSALGRLERVASDAYGCFADYGLSIGRPFFWLMILWVTMSLTYAYLGGESWTGQIDWDSVVHGMAYSLHQAFPLGVFDVPDTEWLNENVLGKSPSIENIGVRLMATLQTILSAILIYLGVMAIRRKFKIG